MKNIVDAFVGLPSQDGALSIADYRQHMDRAGICRALIAPSDECVAVYNQEGNEQTLRLTKEAPDRFSGLAVANPWYGRSAVNLLERCFDQGLSGLYLHPGRQGFHLTESIVDRTIEVCIEHDKPIFCHTGTPICSEPFQLAELARRFPKARFVMGHAAWSDFSGYDVIPALGQAPNIWLDTSLTVGAVLRSALEAVGPERLMFSSAFPRSIPDLEVAKVQRIGLSESVMQSVMSENALAFWKLPRPSC